MVYRVYVEKRPELASEAEALKNDIRSFLGIRSLERLRIVNRYDAEGIGRELFDTAVRTVFSEPQSDEVYYDLSSLETAHIIAVEFLPGQFDQRADSAAQCIQIISRQDRPNIKTAKLYALYGDLSEEDLGRIEKYLINPVESRRASLDAFDTLISDYPIPDKVRTLEGFREMDESAMDKTISDFSLAMDREDLRVCRDYFIDEGRDPTVTELKMLDTYWSDHCRHTTFNTTIDSVEFSDELLKDAYNDYLAVREKLGRTKPQCLMDIGTIAAKLLRSDGRLRGLDESDEINACTVKIKADVDGREEDWLLLFKNETHNHPTEIEPFGGAATCIGGAIRDPLSGRSYVYAAMRITGAADPLRPVSETLPGKLPQRKIVTTAAAGYSSYGNQIGLATGLVDELYHDGYAAKRMEIGAVLGAVPAENVRRETPAAGDVVILLGGRTGRDGIGGATGSSKSHTLSSLEQCGAEVQKGNAPEERKLQRLFRNKEAARMIKRCNDFGAGGVSVAVGELADGLRIDLDKVTKKYEGLDGTELAISESQERMAVVVAREDAERFCRLADTENLEATVIAEVTEEPRLVMYWRGDRIVDISRAFLDTNGAEKHIDVRTDAPVKFRRETAEDFKNAYIGLASDLNVCSKRGLSERFDSTIGAGTVLMPFGGKNQLTPIQTMVHKLPVEQGHTDTCSFMSWGYNPYISEKSPYHGAYLAVVESVSKLAAAGAVMDNVYLTFQEYFEKLGRDPKRWGKPFAALLGALKAQTELGAAAIGGKDSMSGSFEELDVPPTLVSFAVSVGKAERTLSPEFKRGGSAVVWLRPEYDEWGIPETASYFKVLDDLKELIDSGRVLSAYTPAYGGAAEAVMKMCFGNGFGFDYSTDISVRELFDYSYGSFIVELNGPADTGTVLGFTTEDAVISRADDKIPLSELLEAYESKLEPVFACNTDQSGAAGNIPEHKASEWPSPLIRSAAPKVLIPVFPGTNCEVDSAKAFADAGAVPEIFVINNLSAASIADSVKSFARALNDSQMLFIPGGFSAGDEPDGSGKFIAAFLRSGEASDALAELTEKRMGLVCGICNGFQALIKLGLVPYGRIIDADENCPTLTFNSIGRHQSRMVNTKVVSNKSPWLMNADVGGVYSVAISHGEGRFIASEELISELAANGQIVTRYADLNGEPSMDVHFNPNNSMYAIEGICSPDGRVMGKMGHCERIGRDLYKNVGGNYDIGMFRSAVEYFK
jgi:phosphoribosylformylglycinamidine synthase